MYVYVYIHMRLPSSCPPFHFLTNFLNIANIYTHIYIHTHTYTTHTHTYIYIHTFGLGFFQFVDKEISLLQPNSKLCVLCVVI